MTLGVNMNQLLVVFSGIFCGFLGLALDHQGHFVWRISLLSLWAIASGSALALELHRVRSVWRYVSHYAQSSYGAYVYSQHKQRYLTEVRGLAYMYAAAFGLALLAYVFLADLMSI